MMVDCIDVEEMYTIQKTKRKTCYEKSCIRKPTIELTLTLGKLTITGMFCERCAETMKEVFGWQSMKK